MNLESKKYIENLQQHVENELREVLPAEDMYPPVIHKAMRYSVLAGGKRIRPVLTLLAHAMLKGSSKSVLKTACAIELLHTYSLIHDDLPCMDDDDLRRGKPTSHIVFGEAVAVLAGDGLSALAFELLATCKNTAVPREVAKAIGSCGMIGGQVMDVLMEGKQATKQEISYIHTHKTGKLLSASIAAGALEAGASAQTVNDFREWGEKLGVAFQIIDDILNIKGTVKDMGKSIGSDVENEKNTYPAIFGLEESEQIALRLVAEAKEAISHYYLADHMNAIADLIITRIS